MAPAVPPAKPLLFWPKKNAAAPLPVLRTWSVGVAPELLRNVVGVPTTLLPPWTTAWPAAAEALEEVATTAAAVAATVAAPARSAVRRWTRSVRWSVLRRRRSSAVLASVTIGSSRWAGATETGVGPQGGVGSLAEPRSAATAVSGEPDDPPSDDDDGTRRAAVGGPLLTPA